jgi:hypothetical protein
MRDQERSPGVAVRRGGRPARRLALLGTVIGAATLGCQSAPVDLSEGPAPLRMPRPGNHAASYEESLTGGEVFAMYCNQCHNARALSERPYINYENAAAHMRVRANLTGEEYAKLLEFMRRWHDVPSPTPPVEPSPKRLIFSQPMSELREDQAAGAQAQPAAGQPAAAGGVAPAPVPAPAPPEPLPAPIEPGRPGGT